MSANIGTMLYVGETPWHGLGTRYETPPTSSQEIIQGAQLGWEVAAEKMVTNMHGPIKGYHAIYREDNNQVLGVVNRDYPVLIQNTDTFNTFDKMLGDTLDVETAASLGLGEKVFGCFKVRGGYKVADDEIDHYFVVLNDHLKVDGKVTVFNTPIRVVCQNTLSAALAGAHKMRIPITDDVGINESMAAKLMDSVDGTMVRLRKKSDKMLNQKITREQIDIILDELFPFTKAADDSLLHSKANENVEMMRSTFLECLQKDDLANYRGTSYQVFNALTDFTQHYYRDIEKSYDLNYRMKRLPGLAADSEPDKVAKYLKIADKLIA